jgi:Ca2+-binding EF-hand superfamily protein
MDVVQAFRTWDTNGDGTLSKAELCLGLDKLGLSLLKRDFDVLFTEMDANGNGLVEINELKHFMGRVGTNTDRGDNRYAYNLHLV